MRKILFSMITILFLVACGGSPEPDYTSEQLEEALNNGEDATGKIVSVEVKELIPDSAFGYNIVSGKHLNFVSSKNPGVEVGDEIVVEITEVDSMLGSYIISYEKK